MSKEVKRSITSTTLHDEGDGDAQSPGGAMRCGDAYCAPNVSGDFAYYNTFYSPPAFEWSGLPRSLPGLKGEAVTSPTNGRFGIAELLPPIVAMAKYTTCFPFKPYELGAAAEALAYF